MHNAALEAAGLEGWRYQHLPVPPELFAATVRALPRSGFAGANVTLPHKEAALALAEDATPEARAIGAANTLGFEAGGAIAAANTDAPGLLRALADSPAGLRALVLGAGGSARAAVWALRCGGAREVLVWSRSAERARSLADDLDASAVDRPAPADLLVNCTPVGLVTEAGDDSAALKQLGLAADEMRVYASVMDLVPLPDTPLLRAARTHGARVVDGLEVLVQQGALSFERWTGHPAPLAAMRKAVRGDH
jgi:shikimate dehydrogenase